MRRLLWERNYLGTAVAWDLDCIYSILQNEDEYVLYARHDPQDITKDLGDPVVVARRKTLEKAKESAERDVALKEIKVEGPGREDDVWVEHTGNGEHAFTQYHGFLKCLVSKEPDPDIPEMTWKCRATDMGDLLWVDYFTTETEAKRRFEEFVLSKELEK